MDYLGNNKNKACNLGLSPQTSLSHYCLNLLTWKLWIQKTNSTNLPVSPSHSYNYYTSMNADFQIMSSYLPSSSLISFSTLLSVLFTYQQGS